MERRSRGEEEHWGDMTRKKVQMLVTEIIMMNKVGGAFYRLNEYMNREGRQPLPTTSATKQLF